MALVQSAGDGRRERAQGVPRPHLRHSRRVRRRPDQARPRRRLRAPAGGRDDRGAPRRALARPAPRALAGGGAEPRRDARSGALCVPPLSAMRLALQAPPTIGLSSSVLRALPSLRSLCSCVGSWRRRCALIKRGSTRCTSKHSASRPEPCRVCSTRASKRPIYKSWSRIGAPAWRQFRWLVDERYYCDSCTSVLSARAQASSACQVQRGVRFVAPSNGCRPKILRS